MNPKIGPCLVVAALVAAPFAQGRGAEPGDLPRFRYQGVVLEAGALKYRPHDDVIYPSVMRVEGRVENPLGNMFMSHRWTLDYDEDWQFISRVYEEFRDRPGFSMQDVLGLLERKPEIARINQMHAGINWYRKHEGELKTVTRDQYRKDAAH